jgi:predicted nuclease of predicted toxin-antitoxin system
MRILFDQGTPVPLRQYLSNHQVDTAFEKGWSDLKNGDLLRKAEQEDYHLLITTDKNLRYQQNLAGRQLSILVLMSTSWPRIRIKIQDIQLAIDERQLSGNTDMGRLTTFEGS